MTYPRETREKFIELRASSVSLEKICNELGISYNTAVNWNREFRDKIEAARSLKMEELIEKYRITKEKRIELFGERLLAINDELAKRDLSEITAPKLFEMMIKCATVLEEERKNFGDLVFHNDDDIRRLKKDREEMSRRWKVMDENEKFDWEIRHGRG